MFLRIKNLLTLALCLGAVSAHAFCGFYAGKADSSLFNEASQVVVVRDGTKTVISMLNDYKGDLREFALVVPTPVALKQGQVKIAEKTTFDRLDAYSSPRLAEYHDNNPCVFSFNWGWVQPRYPYYPPPPAPAAMVRPSVAAPAARAQALGVKVEEQFTLGEYDIASLSAKQSDGLETWLSENGYRLPKGASAALKPYINQGMKFFVAKVNLEEQNKTGFTMLRPLQFAFDSERFMLPMRLGMLNAAPDKPQDLIVYMLTKEGRVESSNYRTVKLPANMNLPFFVKPKFQQFYKAMFDNEAKKEDHKVVFTEYFWDMGWCDPCAANPLSALELRKAGVFWVTDDVQRHQWNTGAQPVVLTRMHVRYTPRTFPEDLMFHQTKDRNNWQTRYVIQQPYASSMNQCSTYVGTLECEAICKPKVSGLWSSQPKLDPSTNRGFKTQWDEMTLGGDSQYKGQTQEQLQTECVKACVQSKNNTLQAALNYYERALPARLNTEKQTLARLTGWGMAEIDAMPEATKFGQSKPTESERWWSRLFGVNRPI